MSGRNEGVNQENSTLENRTNGNVELNDDGGMNSGRLNRGMKSAWNGWTWSSYGQQRKTKLKRKKQKNRTLSQRDDQERNDARERKKKKMAGPSI